MNEEWKDIEGYEGYYAVSTNGNIKSLQRRIRRSNGRVQTFKEKTCSQWNKGNNRLMCHLSKKGKGEFVLVHREVAKAFIDNPENKKQINHKDGNSLNNNVENLEWCTDKENMKHATEKGLNNHYVLDLKEEEEIKQRFESNNISKSSLAKEYKVSRRTIGRIINNERKIKRVYKWKN